MNSIRLLQENVKKLYNTYTKAFDIVIRFLLSLVVLLNAAGDIGNIKILSNSLVVIGIALVCSFLPVNIIAAVLILFVTANVASISLIVGASLFILMLIFYFIHLKVSPKMAYLILIFPICLILKLPFAAIIVIGILFSQGSIVSILGTSIIYYLIRQIKINSDVLKNASGIGEEIKVFLTKMLLNRTMIASIVLIILSMIIINSIKKMQTKYSKEIAICITAIMLILGTLIANTVIGTDFSVFGTFLQVLIGGIVAFVFKGSSVRGDYKKARKISYEDDEYYYYIKVVPKIDGDNR